MDFFIILEKPHLLSTILKHHVAALPLIGTKNHRKQVRKSMLLSILNQVVISIKQLMFIATYQTLH